MLDLVLEILPIQSPYFLLLAQQRARKAVVLM
jgi:hypothetical protein